MNLIGAEFARALEGKVRRKHNNTGNMHYRAARITSGAPEVMVKISSYGKGAGSTRSNLAYITRIHDAQKENVAMENERGEIFKDPEDIKALAADWEQDFVGGKKHPNRRDTLRLILSMPENTPPDAVKSATRAFTKKIFHNHEYVFALHTDEPHPHCHVTIKMLGHNGKRLDPRKADLAHWRDEFAQSMRDQGIEAEATRRATRGIVRKADNTIIRHIEQGDATHAPRTSTARRVREAQAIREYSNETKGLPVPAKPWEDAIRIEQNAVRRAWLAAAAALDRPPIHHHQELRHDRPDYQRISIEQIRAGQRASAACQRDLAPTRSDAPPRTLTSLRDLPCLDVVHRSQSTQMLLQPDARHHLGRGTGAGDAVRRARTGLDGDRTSSERSAGQSSAPADHIGAETIGQGRQGGNPSHQTSGQGSQESRLGTASGLQRLNDLPTSGISNATLAGRIRGFVAAMPGIDTERHRIKQDLVRQFTVMQPAIQPAMEQSLEQTAPKNIER